MASVLTIKELVDQIEFNLDTRTINMDEHLPVEIVHWVCKGKCYKPWLSDEQSVRAHIRVIFPSGMIWYVCTICGARVIFDDAVDRDISVIPDMKERKVAMDDYSAAKASMEKMR